MNLTFRKATTDDLPALEALYDRTFSAEEAGYTTVGWKRDIYPTTQTLTDALRRDDLFVAENGEQIVSAAVFNQLQSDYYAFAPWRVDARADEVMVMHTFAVDPVARGCGCGRAMVQFYERYAREQGCRVLRIDTNIRNTAGLLLYAELGFERVMVHPHQFEGLPELSLVLLEKDLTDKSPLFRRAAVSDIAAIAAIYDATHTVEEAGGTTIGWVRDIYPTRATAEAALARGDLFVEEVESTVVGAAILNHVQGEEYAGAPWRIKVADDHILVMHTLVIDPSVKGHGLGTAFANFYARYAQALGCSALRIDTNKRNQAARALYAKLGYQEIAIVPCQFNGIDGVELVLLEKALD